jgi:hypothetical protein
MARYNTSYPVSTSSGAVTLASPEQGQFTTLEGTAPYTVTLPDPNENAGKHITFWNNTGGNVTLTTPSGVIRNITSTENANWVMVPDTIVSLACDGTDFIGYVFTGGPVIGTSGQFTSNVDIDGTLNVDSTAQFNGSFVRATSSFAPSSDYDLITKTYLESNYGKPWVVQSSNTTATAGARYFVNTASAAITITLPSGPSVGDEVHFIDYARTFANSSRGLTVARNGQEIMGVADDLSVTTQGAAFSLVYSGSSYGWLITHGI